MKVRIFVQAYFIASLLLSAGASVAGDPTLVVDRPRQGDMLSGIVDFRGWALSTDPIDFIEVFVDDVSFGRMGYGGSRNDVSGAFPGFPDSANPGFAGAFNLGRLEPGVHDVRIVVRDSMGHTKTVETGITTYRFGDRPYLRSRLAAGQSPLAGRSHIGLEDFALLGIDVSYADIMVDTYSVYMSWNEQIQNFEITRIFDEQVDVGDWFVSTPTNLEAVKSGSDVALQWVLNSPLSPKFKEDGIYVERRYFTLGINAGSWKRLAILPRGTTNYRDTTVSLLSPFPSKYEYRVISFTTENQSDPSNVVVIAQGLIPLAPL